MVASNIDVINMALARLGANFITSINENSVEAMTMKAFYDTVRRNLLRTGNFNFSLKQVGLAEDLNGPLFGYSKSFTLPNDYLRIINIAENLSEPPIGGGYFSTHILSGVNSKLWPSFKVIGNALYANTETLQMLYIADETDVTKWGADFIELMAVRLAFESSYKITGSIQMRSDLSNELMLLEQRARENNGLEGTRESIEFSDFLFARNF